MEYMIRQWIIFLNQKAAAGGVDSAVAQENVAARLFAGNFFD